MLPELVIEAHRLSPIGHRTLRIGYGDFGEFLPRLLVLERVQPRDTLIECLLRSSIAGDRERHRAEFRSSDVVVVALVGGEVDGSQTKQDKTDTDFFHGGVMVLDNYYPERSEGALWWQGSRG